MTKNKSHVQLRDPLDDNPIENKKESVAITNKETVEHVSTNTNADTSGVEKVYDQNRELRNRLDLATTVIKELKETTSSKIKSLQDQLEQYQRQNHNLQTSNATLLESNKKLKQELNDENARAATVAASEIVKSASEFSEMTKKKVKEETNQYREKTISQAEAQAHEIKHDADEYANQAKERAHKYNSDYNTAKEQMVHLVQDLQTTLSKAEVVPENETSHRQTAIVKSKNETTSQTVKHVANNATTANKAKPKVAQGSNKVVKISTELKPDKVQEKATETVTAPATDTGSVKAEKTTANAPKVHQLLSSEESQREIDRNNHSIKDFDDLIAGVQQDNLNLTSNKS